MPPEDKVKFLLTLAANAMAHMHTPSYPMIIGRNYNEKFNEFYDFYEQQLDEKLAAIDPLNDKHAK